MAGTGTAVQLQNWKTRKHGPHNVPYGMPSHSSNPSTATAPVQNQAAISRPTGEPPAAWEACLFLSFQKPQQLKPSLELKISIGSHKSKLRR